MLQLEYRLPQVIYTRGDAWHLRFSVSKQVTSQIAANRVNKGVLANNHELSHHPVCPKQLRIAIPASSFPHDFPAANRQFGNGCTHAIARLSSPGFDIYRIWMR